MSGGCFNYRNDELCHDIFGWSVSPDYGKRGYDQANFARRLDPLDDIVLSELVFDVFCILHSYDWWQSGDTDEETYRKDVTRFKQKWLQPLSDEYIRLIVDDELNAVRDKLHRAFNTNGGDT